MRFLCSSKLSEHRYKTPEGYLVCVDSVLSRTGAQTYTRDELFHDSDMSEISVNRTPEEVFSDAALASFENKPLTIEHPDEDVNPNNHNKLSVGFVRDIKRGKDNGTDVMLGTLVITDSDAIELVESGRLTDLSCGYDCDISDEEMPQQKNIRGNHVALCEKGRAGNARIVDSVDVEDSMKDAKELSAQTFNELDEIIKNYQRKYPNWKFGEIRKEKGRYVVSVEDSMNDEVKPTAKSLYKGYDIIATSVNFYNAPTQIDIYEEGTKKKFKSYFTAEKDLNKAINEAKTRYMAEVPLTKKNKDFVSNYLHMISGFVRRKDTDIQDILRPLYGKGYKCVVDKVQGWNWKQNQYATKDYYISFDGYTNHFIVTLYADPEQDWDTKEVNAYFLDSVNDSLFSVSYKDGNAEEKTVQVVASSMKDAIDKVDRATSMKKLISVEKVEDEDPYKESTENLEKELEHTEDSVEDWTIPNWFKSLWFEANDKFHGNERQMQIYMLSKTDVDRHDFDVWFIQCKRTYEKNTKYIKTPEGIEQVFTGWDSIEDSKLRDTTIEVGKTYKCASGAILKVKKVRADISDYDGKATLWIWYDWTSASGKKSGSSDCSDHDFFEMLTDKKLTGDSMKDAKHTYEIRWINRHDYIKGTNTVSANSPIEALEIFKQQVSPGWGLVTIINMKSESTTYQYSGSIDKMQEWFKANKIVDAVKRVKKFK